MDKICSVDDCGNPVEKRGWCGTHYRRWQRHGDVETLKKRSNGTGCIYIDAEGYMRFQLGRHSQKLHRMIMEFMVGRPLLRSEHVHHKDENKLNNHPDNLELVSPGEHTRHHHKNVADHGINCHEQRYCASCDTVKPSSEFHNLHNGSFGKEYRCKHCKDIWRVENRDRVNEMKRARRARIKGLAKTP